MRPSSKTAILEAAVRVAGRGGIGGVTLDAVAAEAGLTKGGLIYHFPSKELLLLGVATHIADEWEEAMEQELGKPFSEAGAAERARAYARVVSSTTTTTLAELLLLVEVVHDDTLAAPWRDLVRRWVGQTTAPVETDVAETSAIDRAVARFAADGLWLAESTGTSEIDVATRAAVIERIDHLARKED
jgi:AcrR family transcriptional regulator